MKKEIIIIMLHFFVVQGNAQQIAYEYDAAGNRISRHVGYNGSQAPLFGTPKDFPPETYEKERLAISVGPNPTSGQLTVSLSCLGKEDVCDIQLVNAAGQTIFSQSMSSSKAILDLSRYANGIYLLKINLNEEITTYKIIKK